MKLKLIYNRCLCSPPKRHYRCEISSDDSDDIIPYHYSVGILHSLKKEKNNNVDLRRSLFYRREDTICNSDMVATNLQHGRYLVPRVRHCCLSIYYLFNFCYGNSIHMVGQNMLTQDGLECLGSALKEKKKV